jgi:Raf kinase inhibitor-like YbhB/YbcL family protein
METLVLIVAAAILVPWWDSGSVRSEGGVSMDFTVTSSAFRNDGDIPRKFTCDGTDRSPELSWAEAPQRTRSLALIVDDPDAPAGTWVHWVIYDIPPDTHQLAEGIAATDELPSGIRQGINDFRRTGYGGPCPPPGKPHRYFFRLYALDTTLGLKPRSSRKDVDTAMKGHILGQAQLMGRYGR